MTNIDPKAKFLNSRFEIKKKYDTPEKFKHSRFISNLDFKDQTVNPIEYDEITLNYPNENCAKIIQYITIYHKLSFAQFCEFATIEDLDLFKRFISDEFSINIILIDENNFTKFFIDSFPFENERINDSMFSIFTSLVSKCYRKDFQLIINECIPNLSNKYYMDLFIAICMNHYFDDSWNVLLQHIKYEDNPFEFLKASIYLIKHKIYPPNRDEFISNIVMHPAIGIFHVLDALDMTRDEIQKFQIEILIISALENDDYKINSDALYFLSRKKHLYLLENDDIVNLLFSLLELGDYNQKKKIIIYFYDIINLVPYSIVGLFIEKGLIESCCELFNGISLQVQYVCLQIIQICINAETKNVFKNGIHVIERLHDEELYDTIFELTESRDEKISQSAQQIINEILDETNKIEPLNL